MVLEDGQDASSLEQQEGLEISSTNTASYVRIQTDSSGGEYEFYYSTPSGVSTATSFVVEFSALVVDGSGSNWSVELLNRASGNNWDTIGDLSSAGSDWSTISLVVSSPTLTDYLDSASNDEMLVRMISSSDSQLAYIDFALILATSTGSPATPSPVTTTPSPVTTTPSPVTTTPGTSNIVYVDSISGMELEEGQDSSSLEQQEGLAVSSTNTASYMRIQTDSSGGEYEFYYSTPSGIFTSTSIVVEFSALVVDGSGNNWVIEILNRGSGNNWDTIGDLSSAGSDWSTVSLVVESPDITDYLDSAFNDEMLVRVISPSDSQLAYIDFARISVPGV